MTSVDQLVETAGGRRLADNGGAWSDAGAGIADVTLRLARGERRLALEAFTEAVASGWHRVDDPYQVSDALAGEAEFETAMEIIDADIASQREWLAEQQRLGALPALPR
jgi:hypothetical protein